MKPDIQLCRYCGEEIVGRKGKEFCKEAHRKAFARNPDKAVIKADIIADKPKPDTKPDKLTKTDQTFYDRAMKDFGEPYYHFDGKLREEKCGYCGKAYKTNLSLNKYCSYEHYHKALHA